MKEFGRIIAAHGSTDAQLAALENGAFLANDQKRANNLKDQRFINDQAYFILLFAQLESYVNQKCEVAITRRASSPHWHVRRAWDTFATTKEQSVRISRITFEDRLALLLDKQGNDFRKIMEFYEIRNHIAHGGFNRAVSSIVTIAQEFRTLAAKLNS